MATNVQAKCPSCGCERFKSAGEAEPDLDTHLTCVDCGRATTKRELVSDIGKKIVKDGLKDLGSSAIKIKF